MRICMNSLLPICVKKLLVALSMAMSTRPSESHITLGWFVCSRSLMATAMILPLQCKGRGHLLVRLGVDFIDQLMSHFGVGLLECG